jgi:hypothetical protein
MRDFEYNWPIYLMVGLIVVPALFCIVDYYSGETQDFKGTIHELHFVHGNQSTTVGFAYTSKGAAPVIATSGHPDEWSVIVKFTDVYAKIECSTSDYYGHEIGDNVTVRYKTGGITDWVWSAKLVN